MNWPWTKRTPEKISKVELVGLLPKSVIKIVLDREYSLPTDKEVFSAIGLDESLFVKEENDCDDFSFRAKGKVSGRGWPFAVLHVDNHCIIGWVNDQRNFVFIEPQTRLRYGNKIENIYSIII